MNIDISPGTYVVAVSGGVDSMVLLHNIASKPCRLVVAHFDHGIREDSADDRRFVQSEANSRQLPFVYHEGKLGPGVSEATARTARYKFLHAVRVASGAQAVITAHHQDDILETVLLNVIRGTGRKGFSSLRSTNTVIRPLLAYSKPQLQNYAQDNQILWREDKTNNDDRYLRNYLRHNVLPKLTPAQRQNLLSTIERMHKVNDELDRHLLTHLHIQPALDTLDRQHFIMLPHAIGLELLAAWLRSQGIRDFDKKKLQRLSLAAKTFQSGHLADINATHWLLINRASLALLPRDR